MKNSVFFRDCTNCTIYVPWNQFRWRDLYNSTIYLFCETDPVIESSADLTFAPYNVQYPLQAEHLAASELEAGVNNWDKVFNFTDTNETGEKLVHHKLLEPSEFQIIDKPVEGFDQPLVNPFAVPQRYGGTAPDNDLTQHEGDGTFDIRTTSKEQAEELYQQHQNQENSQADDVLQSDQPAVVEEGTHVA